jgi:hypothetical protein
VAAEEDVAVGVQGVDFDAVLGEEAVEVALASPVERVVGDAQAGALHFGDIHFFGEHLEIGGPGVDFLDHALGRRGRLGHAFALMARRQALELLGDLGQGRGAVGGGELDAVVLGRVVAGGEVDAAVGLPPANS